MPGTYPTHTVVRFSRRTRAGVAVASGLTHRSARALAAELRERDRAHEADFGYTVGAMTLAEQAALAVPTPAFRLAA